MDRWRAPLRLLRWVSGEECGGEGEACGGVRNPRTIYNGVTETDLGGGGGEGVGGWTWTETWTVFLLQRGSTHTPGGLSWTGFLHYHPRLLGLAEPDKGNMHFASFISRGPEIISRQFAS
jgi:hypothetical protein